MLIALVVAFFAVHFYLRKIFARSIAKDLSREDAGDVKSAFLKSTAFFRSIFSSQPIGWGRRVRNHLEDLRDDIDRLVQQLNDKFARPSVS